MTLDLSKLDNTHRLLFSIPLVPLQGKRFQPTGFPGLGAATFQTRDGQCLLVESAQSMANWLELTIWDEAKQDIKEDLKGLSHIRVKRNGKFLTDSVVDSHRLNSPYVLDAEDNTGMRFYDVLLDKFKDFDGGFFDRKFMAREVLRLDVGSLVHGVFLSQSRKVNGKKVSLAGGRLRLTRALSAFIEADGVRVAASGGAKKDNVNPSWPKEKVAEGYGNVPFARDEYTAERIILYVNVDLAQIRGYGLESDIERLLILLALFKLRALLDQGMLDLRAACDLKVDANPIVATAPKDFQLPALTDLTTNLKDAIKTCKDKMVVTELEFKQEIQKGKEEDETGDNDNTDSGDASED
jgi:CRISPR-associated protein Csb1